MFLIIGNCSLVNTLWVVSSICHGQEKEAREWVEKQKDTLLEQEKGILIVLGELKKLRAKNDALQEQLEATINYVGNNLHRTDYKAYRQKGLFIGSGAIESAHRTLEYRQLGALPYIQYV